MRTTVAKGSCLVIGETGVGKSTLISVLAREHQLQRREEAKKQKDTYGETMSGAPIFWSTSAGRLIAGMQYLGQWQQRLESVIAELADIGGVLVIENLLDLISIGGREPRDSLGAFLTPYVRSDSLRIIAEASPTELDACRRLLPTLVDALPLVEVSPLSPEHEQELLRITIANRLQSTDAFVDPSIPACISRLCRQFQRQGASPGPAMRFVTDLTGRRRQTDSASTWGISWVLQKFSQRTGLPLSLLDDSQTLSKDQVATDLALDVLGQDDACQQVAGIVTRIKSGVQDPRRPFGSLLLCGPTGVGKTQLAKALAKYLFGAALERTPLVRLDMSEFTGAAAGFRFLNDAYGNPAAWIQQIRSRPLNVLLLDEIEKASSEVFDILLSVLDEGRLSDRQGRVTAFHNTVIVLTSNIGVRSGSSLGFGDESSVDYVGEVRKTFRPEFYNRIDSVISFAPLSHTIIRKIAEKELRDLQQREGLERYGRKIFWSEALITHVTQKGFQPSLGARPLQRTIETDIVAPLSKWLVAHDQPARDLKASGLQLDWDMRTQELVVEVK
jgi:ATP-dependent Clp protease ATP-binding subunit ClpC